MIKKLLFLILILVIGSKILHSQCGTPSSGPILLLKSNSYSSRSVNVEVRLTVWHVLNDDGTGVLDSTQISSMMNDVAQAYLDYGIDLNLCIKEFHNTEAYIDHRGLIPEDCNSINLTIVHETPEPGIEGRASLGGNSAWAILDFVTIMHELGHCFGLHHTHHNCHDSLLSETVYQNNCIVNGPLTCNTYGDGICDTPADSYSLLCFDCETCTQAFATSNTCPLNPIGLDRCGTLYSDTDNAIVENFMSYHEGCRIRFTDDQNNKMLATIDSLLAHCIGNFEACESPISGLAAGVETGNFIFENQTLTFSGDINIKNSTLTFIDCNVKLNGEITADNSFIYIKESTLENLGTNDCGLNNLQWDGITLKNNSELRIFSNSVLKNATTCVRTTGGSTQVINIKNSELDGINNVLDLGENSIFHSNDNVTLKGHIKSSGPNSTLWLQNTNLCTPKSTFFPAIDALQTSVVLIDSELCNFQIGIIMEEGYLEIADSYLHDVFSDGIYASNSSYSILRNSYFENFGMYLQDPAIYRIDRNSISNCNNCIAPLGINADSNFENIFKGNKIKSNNEAVKIKGIHSETKFLCNSFEGSPNANFNWEIVNTLQGQSFQTSAGNVWSESSDFHITGNSSNVIYQASGPDEVPIIDNAGVTSEDVINTANCLIGPDWDLPSLIDPSEETNDSEIVDNCPLGIDCSIACPPGINCEEPCPPGINCLEACPPGINCEEPCPPGINCFETCPPGINCFESCPPGINCFEICPPGINCEEVCPPGINCFEACPLGINCIEACPSGINCEEPCPSGINCEESCPPGIICGEQCFDPDCGPGCISFGCDTTIITEDPILEFLENQFEKLEDERKLLLAQQNDEQEQFELYNIGQQEINIKQLTWAFENSKDYSHEEMFNLLISNPHLMYHPNINSTVFLTSSFNQENKDILNNYFQEAAGSEEVLSLWNSYTIKLNQSKIIQFALKRINHNWIKNIKNENRWLSKVDNTSARLSLANNLFNKGDINNSISFLTNYKNQISDNHTLNIDLVQYLRIFEILRFQKANNIDIEDISESFKNELLTIAHSKFTYSSSKAKGIMRFHFGEEFLRSTPNVEFKRLEFRKNENLVSTSANTTNSKFVLSQSFGKFSVTNNSNENYKIGLYSTDGKLIFSDFIQTGENVYSFQQNTGLYLIHIVDLNGNTNLAQKIVFSN